MSSPFQGDTNIDDQVPICVKPSDGESRTSPLLNLFLVDRPEIFTWCKAAEKTLAAYQGI